MNISFQATAGFQYQIQATEDFRQRGPSGTAGGNCQRTPQRGRHGFNHKSGRASIAFKSTAQPVCLHLSADEAVHRPEGGPGRAIRVSFQSVAGRQYQLQATEDFRSWTPFGTAALDANQLLSFVDTAATASDLVSIGWR